MTRVTRVLGPAVLVAAGALALIAALAYGGAAAPLLLADPGAIVRWGLPATRMVVDMSAAVMIGALVLTSFALSRREREYEAALAVAATGAALCTLASAVTGFFSFLSVTGLAISSDPGFGQALGDFVLHVSLGQAWLATTLISALVTVMCIAVRDQRLVAVVTVLALLALYPLAQQGHAAGTSGHNQAVNSLGLHLVFVSVWLGGLLTMLLIRRTLDRERLPTVLRRYSAVALVAFVVVAFSGLVNAQLRVGTFAALLTPYGMLILAKVGALVLLGLFGAGQRGVLIDKVQRGSRAAFWWFVAAELAFMGIATGVAAALGRTQPPIDPEVASSAGPAEILTGDPLPPQPTTWTWVTHFNFDILWIMACGFGIFFYLAAVWRLHRRGDSWPVGRTISWIAGLLALFYVTNGGINVYEKYIFSVHMLAHMVLTMMVPLLLVPGAPVSLASRAIHRRTDGSRGPREWILWAVHTPFAAVITRPIVAAVLFAGSLWVFYFTPILRWAMNEHVGHEWMIIHFIITGYLFVQVLIGIDPIQHRPAYPLRLTLLLGTMAFHAFFGVALMTGNGLLAADWFGAMGRTWGADPMQDQRVGGGIAWSIGEIPTMFLAIVVGVQWSRADARETKRKDRKADRDHDAELRAYNARLAEIARHDERVGEHSAP